MNKTANCIYSSGIPFQLDRVPTSDVLLPHGGESLRRAGRLRTLARQVDAHSEALDGTRVTRELLALVAHYGVW